MVKITEELVRKKSEHNESIIGTLEELSLHQENVEKIEHLHNWCKNLEILLLQSNLIDKIENLHKLKKLQYLNLAINNIEKIENLERCESLEKLDLTLNFIGDLESVASLKDNIHLKELFLTGNPCANFPGYREYVIAVLPQLQILDGTDIVISDRLKALQKFQQVEKGIRKAQVDYKSFRENQKQRLVHSHEDLDDETYWKTSSEHAPETRIEMAMRRSKNEPKEEKIATRNYVKLYRDGRPLNINKAKLNFRFDDGDPKEFTLELAVYKYLDTSMIDVDLQTTHVKVEVKGKIFQFVFPEEICVDRSNCQRSQTTGHLVLKMPKLNYKEVLHKNDTDKKKSKKSELKIKSEFLEVSESSSDVPPLEFV